MEVDFSEFRASAIRELKAACEAISARERRAALSSNWEYSAELNEIFAGMMLIIDLLEAGGVEDYPAFLAALQACDRQAGEPDSRGELQARIRRRKVTEAAKREEAVPAGVFHI